MPAFKMARNAKRLQIIFPLVFAAHLSLPAQNLVPNGDFETSSRCPTESAQYNLLNHWESVSQATPDLFCDCASDNSLVKTSLNFAGRQKPHSGTCYAGLLAYHSDEYYEYLQVKLSSKLVKNKKYLLSFYYTLSDFSNKQVNRLGARFTIDKIQLTGQPKITEENSSDSIHNNIRLWKEFKTVYTAKGDEQYLSLGCFTPGLARAYGDPPPEGYGPGQGDLFAYYYLDDVSLIEYSGGPLTVIEHTKKDPVVNTGKPKETAFITGNIYFDTDKSVVLSRYYVQLHQLALYLEQHPTTRIGIAGHTDNTGSDADNEPLGLERAQSVKNFLVKKGISETRITCTGYSSKKPAKSNDTAGNRQSNRRVELKLIER